MSDIALANGFEQHETGSLVWLTSDKIQAKHAFTTRLGGVSKGALSSLNLVPGRGDSAENLRENHARLARAVGLGTVRMCRVRQVAGNAVLTATAENALDPDAPPEIEADAIVTAERGLPLMVAVADCVPVLLHDGSAGVAAAVHCGWRGSVSDVLGRAVERMLALGAHVGDIRAAIGPAIGSCCFQVGLEVIDAAERWLGALDGLARRDERGEDRFLFDLKGANARRLVQLGVPEDGIGICTECTMCLGDKYWSNRLTAGKRGAQAVVIVL